MVQRQRLLLRPRDLSIDEQLREARRAVMEARWLDAAQSIRALAGGGASGELFRTLGDHFELMHAGQYEEQADEDESQGDELHEEEERQLVLFDDDDDDGEQLDLFDDDDGAV